MIFQHLLTSCCMVPSWRTAWKKTQFTNDIGRNAGGVIIWCDFSKLGKVSGKELNAFADVIANMLRLKPASTCAFAVAPILISEKVSSHWRDELRRFEDKFDAKQVRNTLISVRMELPPSSKRVPIVYHAWMLMDEATLEDNIFTQSQLWLDRSMGITPSFSWGSFQVFLGDHSQYRSKSFGYYPKVFE